MDSKEAVEKKLEEEALRRKERIEKWRAEQKRQEYLANAAAKAKEARETKEAVAAAARAIALKADQRWNLEDDAEDEEGPAEDHEKPASTSDEKMDAAPPMKQEVQEEEEDPLDAYMQVSSD